MCISICVSNQNFSDICELDLFCDGGAWSNPELPLASPLVHYSPITPPNALFNSNEEKSSQRFLTFKIGDLQKKFGA